MVDSTVTTDLVSPCCKIYKSELVKNNPFLTGHACEDEATCYKYYYYSNKVVLSDAPLYAYRTNPTSVMHGDTQKLKSDAEWAFKSRCNFLEELGEKELEQEAVNSLLNTYIYSSVETPKRFNKHFITFLKKILVYKQTKTKRKN